MTKEWIFTSNAPHRSIVWSASIQRDFTAKIIIFWNRNRHVFIIHLYAHLCSVFPRGITPWCFNLFINLFNLQRRSLLCGVSNKKREERNHFNINITNRLNAANERHWRFRYIASDVEVFIKNSNSTRPKNLIDPDIFECKFS